MKNQYFGDVGDYGKYGLLRFIAKRGVTIAVNWYLTLDDQPIKKSERLVYAREAAASQPKKKQTAEKKKSAEKTKAYEHELIEGRGVDSLLLMEK